MGPKTTLNLTDSFSPKCNSNGTPAGPCGYWRNSTQTLEWTSHLNDPYPTTRQYRWISEHVVPRLPQNTQSQNSKSPIFSDSSPSLIFFLFWKMHISQPMRFMDRWATRGVKRQNGIHTHFGVFTNQKHMVWVRKERNNGGEREIRTLARFNPTNGLANRPLQPLGYLSEKCSDCINPSERYARLR